MKKIFLAFIFLPVLAFGQEIKQDSLFLNGRLIGRIKSSEREEMKKITTTSGESQGEVKVTIFHYEVYINEFLSNAESNKIESHFNSMKQSLYTKTNGKHEFEYNITETFEGKSNHQISGYYLHKAGELKNGRNNWRIAGSLVATSMVLAFPPSTPIILAASGVGVFTGIVSLSKDYQANKMMKKSGQYLMK